MEGNKKENGTRKIYGTQEDVKRHQRTTTKIDVKIIEKTGRGFELKVSCRCWLLVNWLHAPRPGLDPPPPPPN
jgi:hypothetical protein